MSHNNSEDTPVPTTGEIKVTPILRLRIVNDTNFHLDVRAQTDDDGLLTITITEPQEAKGTT